MPILDFKGKQLIYAHHLVIPYRPLVIDLSKSVALDVEEINQESGIRNQESGIRNQESGIRRIISYTVTT